MRHRRVRSRHLLIAIGCACVASGAGCSLVTSWDGLEGTSGPGDGASVVDAGIDAHDATNDVKDAARDAHLCTLGVVSCGGHDVPGDSDALYRCEADGGGTLVSRCVYGCIVGKAPNPTGGGDSC